jgi:hypothetical protein
MPPPPARPARAPPCRQARLNLPAGVEQPRADRFLLQAHLVADLVERPAFVVGEVHALALLGGQRGQALAHPFAALPHRGDVVGTGVVDEQVLVELVDILGFGRALAQALHHLEARHAEQPGRERRFAAKGLR